MEIIKYRKIYFLISSLLAAASIIIIAMYGLNLGIDFTGGSLMEIRVDDRIEASAGEIEELLVGPYNDKEPLLDGAQIQPTGENGFMIRFRDVTEEEHQKIFGRLNVALSEKLPEDEGGGEDVSGEDSGSGSPEEPEASSIQAIDSEGNPVDISIDSENSGIVSSPVTTIGGETVAEEMRFESIGPIIGEELKNKSTRAIIAVLIAIVLYIAWAFRKVSKPVSSWKYGITAIIALGHDVIIPTGIFAALGVIYGIEIDILFVTALLTILGFSVNDTIVVFDRTRENLARDHRKHDFDWIVNKSVNETIRRSLFTSLTTFLVLLAVYLYGGESIKNFILALMVGVIIGTYSSIFLASPLLVVWEKRSRRE